MHHKVILEGMYYAASVGPGLSMDMTRRMSSMRELCDGGDEQACIRVRFINPISSLHIPRHLTREAVSSSLPGARQRPFVVRVDPGLNMTRFNSSDERLSLIRSAARGQGKVTVGRISRLVPEKDPESLVFFPLVSCVSALLVVHRLTRPRFACRVPLTIKCRVARRMERAFDDIACLALNPSALFPAI